jgi:hypothetical protein
MVGAIAVDLAMHGHGVAIPLVGTIVAIVLQIWRQARTVEKITVGIEDGLRQSLANIPNAEQRQKIDTEVSMNFKALKDTVLLNINANIAAIERSLDVAIADVERGNFDSEAERRRLTGMQRAAREELAAIERELGA